MQRLNWYAWYLEEHPRTCKWLGSPSFISHEKATWKGNSPIYFITYCCISRSSRLDAIRERELKQLRKYQILNIISSAMWSTAPILTALATFAVYSAAYGELTPATAFTAVSLFNVLRFPLTMFPNTVTSAVEANVSVSRLEQFLSSPEITGDLFCLLPPGWCFMIYWRSLGDFVRERWCFVCVFCYRTSK